MSESKFITLHRQSRETSIHNPDYWTRTTYAGEVQIRDLIYKARVIIKNDDEWGYNIHYSTEVVQCKDDGTKEKVVGYVSHIAIPHPANGREQEAHVDTVLDLEGARLPAELTVPDIGWVLPKDDAWLGLRREYNELLND